MKLQYIDDEDDEPGRLTAAAAYLLQGAHRCDACSRSTAVYTVMAAGPLQVEGDVQVGDEDFSCVVRRLDRLAPAIAQAAAQVSSGRFRLDFSRTAGERYFMNHCQHCGAKVGDFFIHNPGEVFWPTHPDDLGHVTGQRIEGPFVFDDPQVLAAWSDDWLQKQGVPVPRPPAPPPKQPRARRVRKPT